MPRHGEIIEPQERVKIYAHEMDISHHVLRADDLGPIESMFLSASESRARAAAAEIDPNCPIIVTVGGIYAANDPVTYRSIWRVRVKVEFQRYVYDDTKRLTEEWERTKHRYL